MNSEDDFFEVKNFDFVNVEAGVTTEINKNVILYEFSARI